MNRTILAILAVACFGASGCSASVADESTLQRHLLANYSSNVRPSDRVFVQLGFNLNTIVEMDIVSQQMTVSGSVIVFWNDSRLTWDPSAFNNVSELYFKVGEIWRPLLVLTNAADEISALGDDNDQRSFQILVPNTGSVFWLAPAFFQSLCSVDVSLFPFDTQRCELVISGWMFTHNQVKFSLVSEDVFLQSYDENGEYNLVGTYTEQRHRYVHGTEPSSFAVFGVELQRRYSYHIINIVLPVLLLELLGVLIFVVPVTSGEKLTFALTMLLSLVVMTTLVAEQIPSTSLQVPLLSIFVLEGVIMSVMELVLTVYILQLQRWHDVQATPGKFHRLLGAALIGCCSRKNKVQSTGYPDDEAAIQGVCSDKTLIVVQSKEKMSDVNMASSEPTAKTDDVPFSFQDLASSLERVSFVGFTVMAFAFVMHPAVKIFLL